MNSASKRFVRVVGVVTALIALFAVLPIGSRHHWLGLAIGVIAIAAIVPYTVWRVRGIRSAEFPLIATVEALAVVVTTLVLGFSAAYLTIDRNEGQFIGLETRVDAVYFTVTTLSTVGYGDISAAGQAARLTVIIQILVNFALLGVAVRALLAAARQRVNDRSPRP